MELGPVLEANEQHKHALDQYTSKLQTELDAVDKLIVRSVPCPVSCYFTLLKVTLKCKFQADVEALPNEDIQGNPGDKWCLHAAGAFEPTSIIDLTKALDPACLSFESAASVLTLVVDGRSLPSMKTPLEENFTQHLQLPTHVGAVNTIFSFPGSILRW